ncbi:hypothetical protein BD410DRAFT_809490 [Rickenella mellea]|uniref:Uncharacterized protein n=1 Tax=Rickenella mellea TaxID=50990 RepID=A0A4Y7PH11_9AGAM|nr:hypothetical protein BD410DRAFT_809490 [Rickenella mellea]
MPVFLPERCWEDRRTLESVIFIGVNRNDDGNAKVDSQVVAFEMEPAIQVRSTPRFEAVRQGVAPPMMLLVAAVLCSSFSPHFVLSLKYEPPQFLPDKTPGYTSIYHASESSKPIDWRGWERRFDSICVVAAGLQYDIGFLCTNQFQYIGQKFRDGVAAESILDRDSKSVTRPTLNTQSYRNLYEAYLHHNTIHIPRTAQLQNYDPMHSVNEFSSQKRLQSDNYAVVSTTRRSLVASQRANPNRKLASNINKTADLHRSFIINSSMNEEPQANVKNFCHTRASIISQVIAHTTDFKEVWHFVFFIDNAAPVHE